MIWRVEVRQKDGILDSIGKSIAKDISDLDLLETRLGHFGRFCLLEELATITQITQESANSIECRLKGVYGCRPSLVASLGRRHGEAQLRRRYSTVSHAK